MSVNTAESNPQVKEVPRRVALQALIMSFGTITSRILGLLRESLFNALFPRSLTDAWYVAFRLPNLFRRLFGEGSLSISFVPVFVEIHAKMKDHDRAQNFVSSFSMIFFTFLLGLTTLGVVFPEFFLSPLLDEAYKLQVEKYEQTLQMSRIMFGFIFLICGYAYFTAILNALGLFGRAAMAPAFFNLAIVISTLIPQRLLQWPAQAVTWGVLVGGVMQMAVLIPVLVREGFMPRLIWPRFSKDVSQVMRSFVPSLLGLGLMQLMTLINLRFASELPEGSISYMNLADRILEFPLSLISVSLGSALLPALSQHWAFGDRKKMRDESTETLSLNLFLSMPAAVGLYFIAHPLVSLMFQRGFFKQGESDITAQVIQIYCFTLIFSSCVRVFVPLFYAMKNTLFPACISLLCLSIHIFLAPALMHYWGIYGLNASTAFSSLINLICLFVGFKFYLKEKLVLWLWGLLKRFLLPLSGMVLGLFLTQWGLDYITQRALIHVVILCATGLFVYFGLSAALEVSEARVILARLQSRFARLKSKRLK